MDKLSNEKIDEINNNTDIVALVSEYIQLEKKGKDYKGLCPFHEDTTPSFSVSPDKNIAHCFVCGGGGNPIGFLQQIENLSFMDACYKLAALANIDMPKRNSGPVSNKPNYDKYYKINKEASDFYHYNLLSSKQGQAALEYLHNRGFSDEVIEKFGIGVAPSSRNTLYKLLTDKGYTPLDLIDLGLCRSNEKDYYDLFTNRIMFPILNIDGEVVAFSGRVFDHPKKTDPKYINTIETKIFTKGNELYNLFNASKEIRMHHRVILFEGQADVIASYRAGIKEAVCSMGTALTKSQAKTLKRFTDKVIICYDGDKAGVNAANKSINILKEVGLDVELILLPDNLDPDDYLKKFGSEKFNEYFDNNLLNPLDYIYQTLKLGRDLSDYKVCEEIKLGLFSELVKLNSQTLAEHYLNKLSADIKVSLQSLLIDYNNFSAKNKPNHNFQTPVTNGNDNYGEPYSTPDLNFEEYTEVNSTQNTFVQQHSGVRLMQKYVLAEIRLIIYATMSKETALEIDSHEVWSLFDKEHSPIYETLVNNYYKLYEEYNRAVFLNKLDDVSQNIFLEDLFTLKNQNIKDPYNAADMADCIITLKNYDIERQINSLDLEIKYTSSALEKLEKIKKKFSLVAQLQKKWNN